MAFSLAPPCSGPLRVPIAVVMAECISDFVAVVTLQAKVDALKSCSAYRTKVVSRAST